MADDDTTSKKLGSTWIASVPIALSDVEKQRLEEIEKCGDITTIPDPHGVIIHQLETLGFVESHITHEIVEFGDPELYDRELAYSLTEVGRLWLKRCTEVLPYQLADLFDSLDQATKRRFVAWAAGQLGMAENESIPLYNFTRAEHTELKELVDGLPDSRKTLLAWLYERYAGREAGPGYEESIYPRMDPVGWMIMSIEDEAYPLPMDSVREALSMLTHDS